MNFKSLELEMIYESETQEILILGGWYCRTRSDYGANLDALAEIEFLGRD